MPRHTRQLSSTQTYHIVIKGADRQLLFESSKDYLKYLDILAYYKQKCHFELFAYCLMSNHVHLLLRHSPEYSLENIFRRINTSYSIWFNMKYDRTGFLQNGRYHSEPVEDERYLLTVVKYIHFNPAKAGLEHMPGESYPWSSYFDYINEFSKLSDTSLILSIVGGKMQFQILHSNPSENVCLDVEQLRKRIPDDVAKEIIFNISNCSCCTEFQKLPLIDRDKNIRLIHEKGVSIRQINRLTGTPRGIIEKICKKH